MVTVRHRSVLERACRLAGEFSSHLGMPRGFLFSLRVGGKMAALYEAYTLCGLVPTQNSPESGIQGVELDRDNDDHVIVTDSTRSVTVYKVSDQKPLGSWIVKKGECITCPAVYNSQTKEYVAVTNEKVVRVWKDEDVSIEKAFKATVSAEVYRVHTLPELEPVVLFRRGAVRLLDALLSAPQQPIEEVLSEEEVIRWSVTVRAEKQLILLFTTEQKGEHFLYVQRFNPNTLVKHKLETESTHLAPLSYAATFRNGNINLLYLFSNGCLYESQILARPPSAASVEKVLALPRSLLLTLPVGEGQLHSVSALPLDEAHIAVLGVPHPSAGAGKDYLCLWNTHFQTLQAARELSGRIYGQLWCYSGKFFVCHGKTLSVIPFECQKSSLAAAVGKLKHTHESKSPALVPSWNSLLHNNEANQKRKKGKSLATATQKSKTSSKTQPSCPTLQQLTEHIKVNSMEEVQKEVEEFLLRTEQAYLQLIAGRLASELVKRCRAEPTFYPHAALQQLVDTRFLCHSVCPELLMLALEKNDFRLCQSCLQLFPDIPEAVTCACLKTFLSVPDADLEQADLEPDSLLFVKSLVETSESSEVGGCQQNGFCPPAENVSVNSDVPQDSPAKSLKDSLDLDMNCPVEHYRGALLNEILQTPYTETLLLPHLKDLTVPQVILFLEYLRFLYFKYSQDAHVKIRALRMPAESQIMDWVCLLLDAHFTVLALAPEAASLLVVFHKFVRSQVKLYSELGKIEGSLEALKSYENSTEICQYSIEVVELF